MLQPLTIHLNLEGNVQAFCGCQLSRNGADAGLSVTFMPCAAHGRGDETRTALEELHALAADEWNPGSEPAIAKAEDAIVRAGGRVRG